jgi:hypothetical protein
VGLKVGQLWTQSKGGVGVEVSSSAAESWEWRHPFGILVSSLEVFSASTFLCCATRADTCRVRASYKPIPAKKENLKAVTFLNCNCISPESPGRRLIEETEFSFLQERAY